jgi:hypothetical protein
MRTKKVEMAVRDPKTKKSVVDEVEVQVVTVNVRNRDLRQRGGHVYTSLVSDMTLQISDTEAAEIKRRRNGAWELVTTALRPHSLTTKKRPRQRPRRRQQRRRQQKHCSTTT